MSRTITPPLPIVLDGIDMDWDGAGSRYYALQSVMKDQNNAKCCIVYREVGSDYTTNLTGHEILRIPEIVSHPHIKVRPDGASAFVLGATHDGKVFLSGDIPGWVARTP